MKLIIEDNLYSVFHRMDETVLDGELIQKDWFPTVNTHVFISHSHKDIHLAKALAGWLLKRFRIQSFIDSCIWGHADNLLKIIDKKYCWNKEKKSYDYKKRNRSTSHVHMMLMTALNKMIDKTECIIFLNTPNSNIGKGINSSTLSPWIYGEIEASRLIRKKIPKRYGPIIDGKREYTQEERMLLEYLIVKYPLNLGHFYNLSSDVLLEWDNTEANNAEEALDILYELTNKIPTLYD